MVIDNLSSTDLAGVVANEEGRLPFLGYFVVVVVFVDRVELLQQRLIRSTRETNE